jgi:YfiH family protein
MTIRMPADVLTPDWPAPANVRAFMTTRAGGVSEGPYASLNLGMHVNDLPECVERNRRLLLDALPGKPLWLNQVHGTEVVAAHLAAAGPAADASWTDRPGVVCAVLVADCLPVVLADRAGTVVGVAHAGWRGLAAGVIENTVRAMNRPAADLVAWLGAAIGPEAFEVGQDVHDAFVARDAEASVAFRRRENGKYLADLYALARQRLNAVGVHAVFGGGRCTFSETERFYSFRRDRTTGRMAALVWIAE